MSLLPLQLFKFLSFEIFISIQEDSQGLSFFKSIMFSLSLLVEKVVEIKVSRAVETTIYESKRFYEEYYSINKRLVSSIFSFKSPSITTDQLKNLVRTQHNQHVQVNNQ